MKEPLGPREAHLWYVRPETVTEPELVRSYQRLLSKEERTQNTRFRFPEDRHLHLVAWALVRTVLSRYTQVPPEKWAFATNEHGRPQVAAPSGIPPVRFNLSHTRGFIACLVALDREVGVDVEHTERSGKLLDIAERFFSPLEIASLRALPCQDQRTRFFEYWTLKESYIKARGVGISLGLSRFSFHLGEGSIRISFGPDLGDSPESWQFALFHLAPHHVLAASIRRKAGDEVQITLRETAPLAF